MICRHCLRRVELDPDDRWVTYDGPDCRPGHPDGHDPTDTTDPQGPLEQFLFNAHDGHT